MKFTDFELKHSLIAIIREMSLEFGEFTLAGGEKSDYYIDCRKSSLFSTGLYYIVESLSRLLATTHFHAVGGPTVGADPIVGAYLYKMGQDFFENRGSRHYLPDGFLVRPEAKTHGKADLVIGSVTSHSRCVFIEDTATSGKSLMRAIDEMKKLNCVPVRAVVVVDRLAGARELFEAAGIQYDSLLTIKDLGITA